MRAIGVGIIGASPDRGWAARAHVPALRAHPDFALTAVATSRRESAEAAAAEFGSAHAFTDPRMLAEHSDVDLVVVTVRVPAHRELVGAALAAGKHVLCEWPLAVGTAEADELAGAANAAGVHHAVGLQARYAPAVQKAREVLARGGLGRITSASVLGARTKGAATAVPAWSAYTYDARTGAGLVEVLGGHVLDTLQQLVGPLSTVMADLSVQRPDHVVAETAEPVEVSAPDHLLVTAAADTGAVASVHVHDGEAGTPRSRIEIAGTDGSLRISSRGGAAADDRQIQIEDLALHVATAERPQWADVPLDAAEPGGTASRNVGRLYSALAADIRTGSRTVPGFADALALHRLLDAVRTSARTGTRIAVPAGA